MFTTPNGQCYRVSLIKETKTKLCLQKYVSMRIHRKCSYIIHIYTL